MSYYVYHCFDVLYSFEVQLLKVKPLCKKNVLKPRIYVYTLTVLIYMNKTIMKWGPCLLA